MQEGVGYPGEESIEAVDLLPLCDIGVVLSYALQRKFLHQVYLIGLLEVLGLQQRHEFKTQNKICTRCFIQLLTMNFCTLIGKVAE